MAEKEKDMFWVWVGGLVVAVILVVVMVKGSEHNKYSRAESLIAEDASNAAYRGASNN